MRITAAPDASGPLPELEPAALTLETLRAGLRRHGCVLVRGLLSPDKSAVLAEGIDHALDAFDVSVAGEGSEPGPWFVPFTPKPGTYRPVRRNWVRASGGIWTADSPRMLFDLLEAVEATGIGHLITQHVGERPVLAANKCTLRRVPITTNGDWHQDGAFLGTGVRSLNLWLSLSHCGRDAPGLDVLPRRLDELAPTGTEGANFDWAVAPAVVADLAAARDTEVLRPGSRRRRPALRPHVPAPHGHRAEHDARAPRDRDVVLRSVGVSGGPGAAALLIEWRANRVRIDAGWCSAPSPPPSSSRAAVRRHPRTRRLIARRSPMRPRPARRPRPDRPRPTGAWYS